MLMMLAPRDLWAAEAPGHFLRDIERAFGQLTLMMLVPGGLFDSRL